MIVVSNNNLSCWYDNLVGGIPTSLRNMSQLRWWTSQDSWKHKSHVPNHQPDDDLTHVYMIQDGQLWDLGMAWFSL